MAAPELCVCPGLPAREAWPKGCGTRSSPCVVLQSKPPTNSFLQWKQTAVLGRYTTGASAHLTQKSAILKRSAVPRPPKYTTKPVLQENSLVFVTTIFSFMNRKAQVSPQFRCPGIREGSVALRDHYNSQKGKKNPT